MMRGKWNRFILTFFVFYAFCSVATASQLPDRLVLNDFWFYDGYLKGNLQQAGYTVITESPVVLYADHDLASPTAGILSPGTEAKLLKTVYIAYPLQHQFTLNTTMVSDDGKVVIPQGETVGYLSRCGADCLAVLYKGKMMGLDVIGLQLSDSINKLRDAEQQWLYLVSDQGLAGWCQFKTGQHEKRWRVQPRAAGGSADFNTILFGGTYPDFQRLTVLTAVRQP